MSLSLLYNSRHFVENDSEVFVALSDTVLNSDVLEYVFSLHL